MKQIKKSVAVFIVFLMMFCPLNHVVFADDGWDGTEYECTMGSGTLDNPYLISTPGELAWFRTQVNKGDVFICAKLKSDIDLNNYSWDPIGDCGVLSATSIVTGGNPYRGTFDGDGHTIKGLNITITSDASNYRYTGLFGAASGTHDAETSVTTYAEIANLTVIGTVAITAGAKAPENVAGICGCGAYLKVSNCTSDVDITVTGSREGSYVAGIIGYAVKPVQLNKCINMGNISGNFKIAGGLIGSGLVDNILVCCCNFGDISGNTQIGGLAGVVSGEVRDCYNVGSVTNSKADKKGSGGLIGSNSGSSPLTMKNCFIMGDCSFTDGNYTGAVYGKVASTEGIISFDNVYYLDTVCEGRSFGLLSPGYYEGYSDESYLCYKTIPKTAAELASAEFVTTLNINSGSTVFEKDSTHPIFVWQKEDVPVVILGDIDGNGTVNSSDVSELIAKIEEDEGFNLAVDDVDGNGTVNVTDVSELITIITE